MRSGDYAIFLLNVFLVVGLLALLATSTSLEKPDGKALLSLSLRGIFSSAKVFGTSRRCVG